MDDLINNNELNRQALRYKKNYIKGVFNLIYVFQVPRAAREFIADGNGLMIVYGTEDRNSAQLVDVIERYGYGDQAMTRYLNIFFEQDIADMTAYADSEVAMTKIAESPTASYPLASSATAMKVIAASSTAMTAVAASSTAMAAIAANATARGAITASTTALTALATSPLIRTAQLTLTQTWQTLISQRSYLVSVTSGSGTARNVTVNNTFNGAATTVSDVVINDVTSASQFNIRRFTNTGNTQSIISAGSSTVYTFSYIPC